MTFFDKAKQIASDAMNQQKEKLNENINKKIQSKTCNICGKQSLFSIPIGGITLCKSCSSKLKTDSWYEKEYSSNDEVYKKKEEIVTLALKMNLSKELVLSIEKYFESRIVNGLVCIVDGEFQKLTVYEDYFKITTYEVDEEVKKKYFDLMDDNRSREDFGLFSQINAVDIVSGIMMPGGIVKKGAKIATSIAVSGGAKKLTETVANKVKIFPMKSGEWVISYSDYDAVSVRRSGDLNIAAIIFHDTKKENVDNAIFLIRNRSFKKVNPAIEYIRKKMREQKDTKHFTSEEKTVLQNISVADEILKFKNLLDMDVITQEEFENKKKELLNIK